MESRRGGGGGQEFDSREAPTASGGDHSPTRRDDANAPSGTTSGMHAPTSTPRTCLSFVAAPPASAAPRGSCPSRGSARARGRSDEQHLPKLTTRRCCSSTLPAIGGFIGLPHSRARPTMRAVRLLAGLVFASLLFTAVSCQDADDELPPLLQACRAQVRRPSGSGYFRDRTVRFRAVRAPHVPSTHPPSPHRLPRSSSRSSRTSPRSSTPTAPS